MRKTTTFSIKKHQRENTHRGGLFHLLLVPVFLIVINLFSATGLAQVSPYAVEISGEASVVVEDNFATGKATYRYFIIERPSQAKGPSRSNSRSRVYTEIFFKGKVNEHFKTGKKLKVHGKRRPNDLGIDFGSLELLEPEPEPEAEPATTEAPVASPETRKIVTILVNFNDADVTIGANAPSLQDVKDIMFHNPKNVSHFYDLASLGTLTIPSDPNGTGGDAVYGPYTINYDYLGGDSSLCLTYDWADAALTAWETDTGYDRSDYRHHSFIVPNYQDYSNRNCSWGGIAHLGCGASCWAFNADPVSILHGVIIHEFGHNFTLGHAKTDLDNDGNMDAEYGDLSDMMGRSRNWKKFNPPHFEYTDWYDPVSYQLRAISPSSTLQLFDLISVDEEDTDWPGLRALKTARGDTTSYYLSYRQRTGHYNNVAASYTTGASLHWRYNTGSDAYASYFIQMIESGDVFVDAAADLVVWGVGPMTIDNAERTDETQVFTLKVCNTTCSILLRPINLAARGISLDAIELTWQDYTHNEDGFTIEYSSDGSGWSALGTAAANAVSYVHSGLSVDNTFYYRVRAYRGASETSDWSSIATATTPLTNPGTAPDLTPETDSGVSDSDNITTDSTPDFYVACSDIDNHISLYTDNPATYPGVGTHICETIGTETVKVTTALAVGIHQIVYTEKKGNSESGNSPSLAITINPPSLTDHFVTTWRTDNPGTSNSTSITVPMVGGPYDVDWNDDGTFDEFGLVGSVTHDFVTHGTYTIRIRGIYDSIKFNDSGDEEKILSLDQWGTNSWKSMDYSFYGASNLQVPASDNPDFSEVTSMAAMFAFASSANPDTSGWETGAVTSMEAMFYHATLANPDTSDWDTRAAKDMEGMFAFATSANPVVSGWNTASVTDMRVMFEGATSFDQDVGSWNVTALTKATSMFSGVRLSTANYDSLLIGWDAQTLQPGVTFSGGNSTYCSAEAAAARTNMIASDSWVITDGGQSCTNTYTVGGNVSGLSGSGLVLQNNEGDDLPVAVDGGFTFTTPLDDGSSYAVTVKTQPSSPTQLCSVANGSGTLNESNITNVSVTCSISTYTVGGTVSGLDGTGLVLQNNAGDDLGIDSDGDFTFATPLVDGNTYSVTVKTQPSSPTQLCSVANGSGTLNGSNITNVTVTCVTDVTDNELRNIATRAEVRTGNEILIGGFIIKGETQKCVVVQGLGQSVGVPDGVTRLADPVLELKSGLTTIASNDNWQDQDNPSDVQAIEDAGWAPSDILEAAIYKCLDPGAYTALVTGYNDSTGVGMVAVYDVDDGQSYLRNIATRSWVGTNHAISIGGFVVKGETPKQILVRGLGPSMESKFPPNSPLLWNPQIRLYKGSTLIETNDDWGDAENAAEIAALPAPLPPTHEKEPAILITLEPGLYTAHLLGVGATTGIGNVAVYDLTGRQ